MENAVLVMSEREIERLNVIQSVNELRLSRKKAALLLEISERQVQRLVVRFRLSGPEGLVSLKRGQPSNRRLPDHVKLNVLTLVREKYLDFGPTLANEHLLKNHGVELSVETLRNWMIDDGLWVPRSARASVNDHAAQRSAFVGEQINIGSSYFDWFEGRAASCFLMVFIDDATGQLMHSQFGETESAFDYMRATYEYLQKHGRPQIFTSDKYVDMQPAEHGTPHENSSQYARALQRLDVALIAGHGTRSQRRVARAFKTLKDRLVKGMRAQGVCGIVAGNASIDHFILEFNCRFSKSPQCQNALHRPISERQLNDFLPPDKRHINNAV